MAEGEEEGCLDGQAEGISGGADHFLQLYYIQVEVNCHELLPINTRWTLIGGVGVLCEIVIVMDHCHRIKISCESVVNGESEEFQLL